MILRPSHTTQNSRKRMNHAQISSLTWYISDLRISSVFLTWNLRSCAPMFAVSVLYAIPGFEQLKTRLRVKVCAVLRCFTYFLRSFRDCPRQRYWDILPYFSKKSHCYFEMTNFYHWNLIRICAILELVWNSPIVLQVQAYPWVCVVLTRTMRGMCVEYQWSSVKTLPL